MDMNKEIASVIQKVLVKVFPKIDIASINVSEHTDDAGDKILEIQVVFDAKDKDFDPTLLRELPRLIMPKLEEMKEEGFPLFSFVSKADLEKKKPATA